MVCCDRNVNGMELGSLRHSVEVETGVLPRNVNTISLLSFSQHSLVNWSRVSISDYSKRTELRLRS